MKKRLGLFLCVILGLSLAGCKNDKPTPPIDDEKPPVVVEDELKDQRTKATNELDGYVKDMSIYSVANQNKIKETITSAKKKVADAKTEEEIRLAVTEAKASIDKLPTVSQENLTKAIEDALKELDSYVILADYSEENQEKITSLLLTVKEEIKQCTKVEDIQTKVASAKESIDKLPTKIEEALAGAKALAKEQIEGYIKDNSVYSKKGLAEIERIIKDAKENIDAALDIAILEAILIDAKSDLDAVLTIVEEKKANALAFKNSLVADTTGFIEDKVSILEATVKLDTVLLDTTVLHFGKQDENKYSVLDTKIKVEYRNTEWSNFSIRFRAWDQSSGYRMEIHNDFINVYTCEWSDAIQGTIETLIIHNSFGMTHMEEVHLQILCHEWKKSVLVNEECIFTIDEGERTNGYTYIDTWQTGITFVEPMYIEYSNSEDFKEEYDQLLWKECINKTEQEKLNEAKVAAKEEIEGYITDLTLYSEVNQAKIAELILAGKEKIDACNSIAEVELETEEIKKHLAAVKTIEREQFEADAIAAKEEIENYITELSVYSEANQALIAKLISDGKLAVDAADSVEAMQEIVLEVKAKLDAVLTITEELILRATNFKNILVDTEGDDIVGTIKNFVRVEDGKVLFDTKEEELTRVHFGNKNSKYVVFDTKFKVDYQQDNSEVSFYFRAWTRSDAYKMVITKEEINVYACTWNNGHVETLLMKNMYGVPSNQEMHLQVLCHEWKKTVLLNGECIFSIEEDTRNAGSIFIETKFSGLIFNEPLFLEPTSSEEFKKEYGILLDKPCINTSEAELLEEMKVEAKIEIEGYITDLTLYSEANQAVIANLILEGKESISLCETKASLAIEVIEIKKKLDAVKTIEREQFEADAIAAKEEIEGYITDLALYSEANQTIILKLISDGKLAVDAADSVEAMQEIVTNVKAALDAVLTLAEESALRAEAFKNILSDELAGSLNDIRLEDNKVVFDTKVVGKSSMVKFGAQDGKNHVAFDTKIIANYNDPVWDSFTIRFRAWDTNDGYKMQIKDGSIVVSKCKWGTADEVVVEKDFGIKNGEETHLQILCSGWKKTVLINGEVIFTIDESERCVGYTYIETWQTGLTFIDPVYTEYPDADTFMAEYGDLLWKQEN